MLEKFEFRTRVVKPTDETAPPEERQPFMTPDNIAVVKDFVKTTTLFVGGVYIATKIVDTACEIAIQRGTPQ